MRDTQTHPCVDSFRPAPSQGIGDRVEGLYPYYSSQLATWQRDALCDVSRRYVKVGRGVSDEPVEGSMFCAQCPYRCCDWPATEELIAEWRAWAYARAAEWEKVAAERQEYSELRRHLKAHHIFLSGLERDEGKLRGPGWGRVALILG